MPLHLRNAPTKLMKQIGYGNDYQYAHAHEGNFVRQNFLPGDLKDHKLYKPGQNAREAEIRRNLEKWWSE